MQKVLIHFAMQKTINHKHFSAVAMVRALCPMWHVSDRDLCDTVVERFS